MKARPDCYECLQRLVYQAAKMADNNEQIRERATKEGLKVLEDNFSTSEVTIVIAAKIHEVIKEITGNPDPYRAMKDKEMTIARELYSDLSLLSAEAESRRRGKKRSNLYKGDFRDYLKLAAAANTIDFFREPSIIEKDIRRPVNFALDDSEQFEVKLKDANKVLYLADNAGEIYFDLPLVEWMRQFANVIYVVKPLPVQDDATLEDISKAGLESEFGMVITTGTASPGIVFTLASEQFKREFESADLIFAKGMGHYESLSELPGRGKFFYCLMAKCKPVADSLGVPVNSYVAMLQ